MAVCHPRRASRRDAGSSARVEAGRCFLGARRGRTSQVAPFEAWCPEDLREAYAPKLPESFWDENKPRRGCSVVNSPNEPVVL